MELILDSFTTFLEKPENSILIEASKFGVILFDNGEYSPIEIIESEFNSYIHHDTSVASEAITEKQNSHPGWPFVEKL